MQLSLPLVQHNDVKSLFRDRTSNASRQPRFFVGRAVNPRLVFVTANNHNRDATSRVRDAVIIGVCQAIATIPGISRSGSTITAGLVTGQEREYAMKFSLIMSIPAVLGANLLSFIKALGGGVDWSLMPVYLLGTAVATVSGYFSIVLLRRIVQRGKFGNFTYYLWGVGVFTLIASLF